MAQALNWASHTSYTISDICFANVFFKSMVCLNVFLREVFLFFKSNLLGFSFYGSCFIIKFIGVRLVNKINGFQVFKL